MGRRWILLPTAAAVTAVLVLVLAAGRRPFRTLRAEDIRSAQVRLLPPDVTADLEPADIETLAALLREVRVTRRDGSYTEYDGQAVVFTLTMADGAAVEAMAYAPFFIIDGVGYRAAYGPCAALSNFGNQLGP